MTDTDCGGEVPAPPQEGGVGRRGRRGEEREGEEGLGEEHG